MTNEELVEAIQLGEESRLGELWNQVAGLVKWKASRVSHAADVFGSRGVEFDDLFQSGYPALVKAVKTYSPATHGTFASWFMLHLKTAFAETSGYRTKKGQLDPLNNAVSLDSPASSEADSGTLLELIADPNGQDFQWVVEDAVWREQLGQGLQAAIASLPKEEAEVLRLRFWAGMTQREASEAMGIEMVKLRRAENAALRRLRAPHNARHLKPFYDLDTSR